MSSDQLSVYCPAGCKGVPGEVKGNSEQGYRDTSVICKAAVHGGVVSDGLGGRVSVTRGKGVRLYESTFANGVLSKSGSLSEHKLLFSKECNGNLNISLVNSSSLGGRAWGQPKGLNPAGPLPNVPWTAEPDDRNPWVELDLGTKRKVTGIITTVSGSSCIESYSLLFRKDRKEWKPYNGLLSKERKVFEAYSDGHPRVLNSLFPPIVARFVQLKPITWQKRASAEIQLLGCPVVKDTTKTVSSVADAPVVSVKTLTTPPSTVTTGHTVPVEHTSDGCGHTKLGPESGTLTSANYPGTYPQDGSCTWRLRVPQGRTLRLLFGDFDIEGSGNCTNGSVVITPRNGSPSIGPLCGREKLTALEMNMSISSNEASVMFKSGRHLSGRGFLLVYTTDQYPELISCKMVGTRMSSDQLSVYCPAGCKGVPGEVKGNSEQGYRDSSMICLSAVHGGVVSDGLGGRVSVTRGKGLGRYESYFANGVLSKSGSLSEHKLLFSKECNGNLNISLVNSSSLGGRAWGQPKGLNPAGPLPNVTWTAEPDDQNPWVELDLGTKRKVTGIITTGSGSSYIESYSLLFRKDRKDWKPYNGSLSKERKVFEAYSDGHPRVLNSLFPPVVARFIQLKPITWRKRASAAIQVLGCPVVKDTTKTSTAGLTDVPMVKVKATTTRPSMVTTGERFSTDITALSTKDWRFNHAPDTFNNPTDAPVVSVKTLTTPRSTVNPGQTVPVEHTTGSGPSVVVVVGVVLGLVMCGSCLLAGFWLKRRKKNAQMKKYSTARGPVDCQSLQRKRPGGESELISYPLETLHALNPSERSVQDTLPSPPLNDYAEPTAGGQTLGSTFRPAQNPGPAAAFSHSRYHGPGTLPDYAEPLPPEPEYATPFSEQLPESRNPARTQSQNRHRTTLPPPPPPPPTCGGGSPDHAHYDCPSHRLLSNGYCTPSHQGAAPRPSSAVYSEPEPPYSLVQAPHTYEELL